jgi:tRNA(Arg) A34 adenosine deaminase TadA
MANLSALSPSELDTHFLRRSFDVARRAMTHGNHPFGALLVDQSGTVLIEAENGYMPSHDGTAHAERLLATQACSSVAPHILHSATLYSSAELCAMCAGAIYWAGIGRLVYGLSEHRLRDLTGNHPENPTLNLPCRDITRQNSTPCEPAG